jgi:hypothetical protein
MRGKRMKIKRWFGREEKGEEKGFMGEDDRET